jgi:cyanophycinase
MARKKHGNLIIIGGKEDKENEQIILKEVVSLLHGDDLLLITTIATEKPEEVAREYTAVFKDLGVDNIDTLDIRIRDDGFQRDNIDKIKQAGLVFFTGGDQLRITSQMGDTPVYSTMQDRYHKGLHVVGTSAGAAVMPATMLISGNGDESYHVDTLGMAPGLSLIEGVVIDSHFAERGRIGRLIGAVTQNPANIGLGIDENTAIVVENDEEFRVIGEGAVYVVDGSGVSYSNLSEEQSQGILTIYDIRLHVLGAEERFDLINRERAIKEDEEVPATAESKA